MTQPASLTNDWSAVQAAHHQIGNSLQTVASLLRLQSQGVSDEIAGPLLEASRRVRVIMRLHQRLQVAVGDAVRFDELLEDVCRDVVELGRGQGAEIDLVFDVVPLVTPAATAPSLALAAAELVSNALKHGLRDRGGTLKVILTQDDEHVRLTISDDGVGAPGLAPGFGLKTVERLVSGLGGWTQVASASTGTSVICQLPRHLFW